MLELNIEFADNADKKLFVNVLIRVIRVIRAPGSLGGNIIQFLLNMNLLLIFGVEAKKEGVSKVILCHSGLAPEPHTALIVNA